MEINKKIVSYLKEKGVSQSELARKINTSQPNLFRMLNVSEDLKVSQLVEITKALDLPTHFFFDDYKEASNNETEALKKRIEELEDSLKDKKALVKEMERCALEKFIDLLEEIFENEYKHFTEKEKYEMREDIYEAQEKDPFTFFLISLGISKEDIISLTSITRTHSLDKILKQKRVVKNKDYKIKWEFIKTKEK